MTQRSHVLLCADVYTYSCINKLYMTHETSYKYARNPTGHKECRRLLRACKAITYHASGTLSRDGKKQYAVTPRCYEMNGSGVRVHVESDGKPFSRAELTALLKFTPPGTEREYDIAIVHLLKKVPKTQAVVITAQGPGSFCQIDDLVNIVDTWSIRENDRSVSVKKCGNNQAFSIHSSQLRLITGSRGGSHALMRYCGDYMQYGFKAKLACNTVGYSVVDEYEAVSVRTGIKMQVCLVPDAGGIDSSKRRRFFWNDRLYSH